MAGLFCEERTLNFFMGSHPDWMDLQLETWVTVRVAGTKHTIAESQSRSWEDSCRAIQSCNGCPPI